jgi:hypothetical protein
LENKEIKDMKTLLKQEFADDPIYRLAFLEGLEESVFSPGILSMHIEISYSTVETGKIIERSDSTIRNHFRSDLIDYIAPEKFGKFYRLNYKSVFRLHLIFLLMEKSSKTTIDILAELGLEPAISMGGYLKRVHKPDRRDIQEWNEQKEDKQAEIQKRLIYLEKNFGIQGAMLNILKYERDLSDIERKIETAEMAINQIKSEAYMHYLEEKQLQMLTNSLKKTMQKPSFFGLFKKSEEIDLQQISSNIDKTLKQKMELEIENKIKEQLAEIQKLKEEKLKVNTLLQTEKERFSNLRIEESTEMKNLT